MLLAYDQSNGASAIRSFGPDHYASGFTYGGTMTGETGTDSFGLRASSLLMLLLIYFKELRSPGKSHSLFPERLRSAMSTSRDCLESGTMCGVREPRLGKILAASRASRGIDVP